jgi:hypothetical protein
MVAVPFSNGPPLQRSVGHLIRNIDEFVLASVRRYGGKSRVVSEPIIFERPIPNA